MKISKKILANKVRKLEVQNYDMRQKIKKMDELLTYLDELTTELNHALPDPEYDAKCEENAVAVEESLARHAVRLGLVKPKLKKLDQSVFDGAFDWVKSAAINPNGAAYFYSVGKNGFYDINNERGFQIMGMDKCQCIGLGYDTTNWQDSLIERESKELTGSDLCRAMLARGDKYISGFGHHCSDNLALESKFADVVSKYTQCFQSSQNAWDYFVPINNQGKAATASEVGL